MKRQLIATDLNVRSKPHHRLSLNTHTQATKLKELDFDVLQVERDAIKSSLPSAGLPTSIY